MRIQILSLPSVVVGDDVEEPFALIVDQYDAPTTEEEFDRWKHFKQECGARAVLVTPETVEVVDRYAESVKEAAEVAAESLLALTRVPGEPDESATLPPEVIALTRAVERMRDQWAKSDIHVRYELWMAVHDASDAVYRGPYQESPPPAPPHFDAAQRLQKAGEAARAALGIYGYGSMDVAAAVPHAYNDSAGEAPYCVACGLGRLARVHELRCSNCGKRLSEPACGPGHAMAAHEIAEQESVTARWPRLQRDRSEDDD